MRSRVAAAREVTRVMLHAVGELGGEPVPGAVVRLDRGGRPTRGRRGPCRAGRSLAAGRPGSRWPGTPRRRSRTARTPPVLGAVAVFRVTPSPVSGSLSQPRSDSGRNVPTTTSVIGSETLPGPLAPARRTSSPSARPSSRAAASWTVVSGGPGGALGPPARDQLGPGREARSRRRGSRPEPPVPTRSRIGEVSTTVTSGSSGAEDLAELVRRGLAHLHEVVVAQPDQERVDVDVLRLAGLQLPGEGPVVGRPEEQCTHAEQGRRDRDECDHGGDEAVLPESTPQDQAQHVGVVSPRRARRRW